MNDPLTNLLLAGGTVIAAFAFLALLLYGLWAITGRCPKYGAPAWQQVDFDNPQLSPTAPILERCKRCGDTRLAPL